MASRKPHSGSEANSSGGLLLARRALLRAVGAGLFAAPLEARASDDYVLVVNAGLGDVRLSESEARQILALRRNEWKPGVPILLVLPPKESAAINWMLDRILHMPESAYRRHLLGQVFKGTGRPPITTSALAEVVTQVATRRGAISALPRSQVAAGIRIVALD